MFSRLPSQLSAPFGILGDEPKLAFRSKPGGIAKLASSRAPNHPLYATQDIPPTDQYWDQYITIFDSPSDVFSLVTPNDIRRALHDAPENVATLIRVICSRLFNLISDHTFPTPVSASVTSLTGFIKSSTSENTTTKHVLNCVRVLQRVLPVVFEIDGETTSFELEVFWKKEEVEDTPVNDEPLQFVLEDDDEDSDEEDAEPPTPATPKPKETKSKKTIPSLAERLLGCLMDLLFCCGFTIPRRVQVDHYKINHTIWEKGVGSTADLGPSQGLESNKTEVLRLLLVLLSRQIYTSPSQLLTKPSIYTLQLVQKSQRRNVLTLLCSLLNTAINSPPASLTTIGGMTGRLPYNHLVFKGEDSREGLVIMCMQVLCALLDCQSGPARDTTLANGESSPTIKTNMFRYYLAKLHRQQDFMFILDGIINILELQMASLNNYLPGAKKSVPYIVETIIIFWKMIELNKKFRAYILDSDRSMDVLAYLLCYGLEVKDKPQQHGLCRSLSYIVQTLSAEKAFSAKLNTTIKVQIPPKWHVPGTAADFLINSVYSMVATTSGTLSSLYPALIIALSNCAPYLKNLSVSASTRLVQLVTAFSTATFLLSDEGNPRLLFFMLEVFNSVILHNLADNPNLVYGVLRARKTFEDLGTFTLARGLREIRRVQLAKEEQARKGGTKGKDRALDDLESGEEPSTEKARLLESEASSRRESAETSLDPPLPSRDSPQRGPSTDDEAPIPLVSPTAGSTPESALSEKARGKLRERSSMSIEMTRSLERVALAGIGRNRFVPTQEWVTSWQQGLPLDPVMLVISELLPKVHDLQASLNKANTTPAIIDFLASANLSNVLPRPPSITPRRFVWSDASIIWLASLIWGEVYVRGTTPLGIWNGTNVRLFYVKHSQTQGRGQISETVTNAIGGLLGRGGQGANGAGAEPYQNSR
ncbi:high-temperature-induced dauer-formation protein-domain-containing protein [Thelephora terrestris]|uniref:High-temperature-induced dauer-formation protein-domain-containing protein n=1 Tax=Thelephora terrestris TaxID=56493 RepID=A0A9P6LC81_9AGAM|nr:high-temperature-induced dauer-formation protein-domain-containing protein [Thelephora terrestris]